MQNGWLLVLSQQATVMINKLFIVLDPPASPFAIDDAGGAEESRDRALNLEELEQAFECLRNNSDQFSRENYLAVALLLMLGVRKMELVSAK